MCMGCWQDHGSPTVMPFDGEALAEAANEIDHFGAFHIVVEDFNIEDVHIQSCVDDDEAGDFEKAWGRRMLELTLAERAAVLGLADGYFRKPAATKDNRQ